MGRRQGTLLIGIAPDTRERVCGVTSDLRTRPGTTLTNGLTTLSTSEMVGVLLAPAGRGAVTVPERRSQRKPVSSVIAPAVPGWVEAYKWGVGGSIPPSPTNGTFWK